MAVWGVFVVCVLAMRKGSTLDLIVSYHRPKVLPSTNRAQPWYFRHDDIMDIDVVVFTPSAPIWHTQGHALHLYIMGDTTVPWFGPIPPIGRRTQKRLVNDLDDADASALATMDVMITINNNATTVSMKEDEGNHLWR